MNHAEFHQKLNQSLKSVGSIIKDKPSAIVVIRPSSSSKGEYADENPRKKITYLSVRSDYRFDTKEKVREILKSMKGISFSETNLSSLGTMGGFNVELNSKTIQIVFKFKNGLETKDFKGWNEYLNKVFLTKSQLKRIPSDRNERMEIEKINEEIGKSSSPITLQIGSEIYNNVAGIVGASTKGGNQKADLVVINMKGQEVCFISYKTGKTATSFQQYSGLTARSKLDQHPEVKDFYQQIEQNETLLSEEKTTLWRPITDRKLKRQSVFGVNYGGKNNENNVNFLIQGNLSLSQRGNRYVLQSKSKFIVRNGDLSHLTRDYEPTLGARPGESNRKYAGIPGVRGGVFPKQYLTNRKNNKQI